MKWITHQTGAVITAVALGLPAAGIAAACAGAILPDVVDQRISRLAPTRALRQKVFNKIHRGPSHWFGWWLAIFLVIFLAPLPALGKDLAAGLAFGALSHIMLDMLTTRGVPLRPFSTKNRLSLHLCSTGQWSEYVFLFLMLGCAIFLYGDPLLNALRDAAASF